MQPLAGVADQRDQSLFEIEMDIFEIARPGELAALDFAADLLHAALDRLDVGGRQHAGRAEHPGVRERRRDVGIGEALIEIDRCGVQLDELGDRLAEAAGPAACGLGSESGVLIVMPSRCATPVFALGTALRTHGLPHPDLFPTIAGRQRSWSAAADALAHADPQFVVRAAPERQTMRTIINQNTDPLALPELRNLGTILRILLAVNAMVFVARGRQRIALDARSPTPGCRCRRWSSRSCWSNCWSCTRLRAVAGTPAVPYGRDRRAGTDLRGDTGLQYRARGDFRRRDDGRAAAAALPGAR